MGPCGDIRFQALHRLQQAQHMSLGGQRTEVHLSKDLGGA
jgi:predicted component of type VI protein secretion system